MQMFAPGGAQLYREGTKWPKGHLYTLIGHLAFHMRALIATAKPGNGYTVNNYRRWNQGARGRLLPKKFHTQNVPFFYVKSIIFKVKHAPSLLRKRTDFLNILSLNVLLLFLPITGHSYIQRRHRVSKGAPLCLNWAFSPSY